MRRFLFWSAVVLSVAAAAAVVIFFANFSFSRYPLVTLLITFLTVISTVFISRALVPFAFFFVVDDQESMSEVVENAHWWFCNANGHWIILFWTILIFGFFTTYQISVQPSPFVNYFGEMYNTFSISKHITPLISNSLGKHVDVPETINIPFSNSGSWLKIFLIMTFFVLPVYGLIAVRDEIGSIWEEAKKARKEKLERTQAQATPAAQQPHTITGAEQMGIFASASIFGEFAWRVIEKIARQIK